MTLWLVAAVAYTGLGAFLLWDDLPLGAVTPPLVLGAFGVGCGYVLGFPATALSLLWCLPVFFFSGDWEEGGDQAVSIFFGVTLGAGALLLGGALRRLNRHFRPSVARRL